MIFLMLYRCTSMTIQHTVMETVTKKISVMSKNELHDDLTVQMKALR